VHALAKHGIVAVFERWLPQAECGARAMAAKTQRDRVAIDIRGIGATRSFPATAARAIRP
jgi:hypothetical protein